MPDLSGLDFSKVSTESNCGANKAKSLISSKLKELKTSVLAMMGDGPGFFTTGETLANDLKGQFNTLQDSFSNGIGEVKKIASSLQTDLGNVILKIKQGATGAADTSLNELKKKFPSFDMSGFLSSAKGGSFSLCDTPEAVIYEGETAPTSIASALTPPNKDANTKVSAPATLPDNPTLPKPDIWSGGAEADEFGAVTVAANEKARTGTLTSF